MKIKAPMPGKVVRVLAGVGTPVEAGQSVLVIEAMKMQNELKAPKTGVVKKINVAEGAAVDAGQALAEVE
jgi:pyruvate carboxylase subunit B